MENIKIAIKNIKADTVVKNITYAFASKANSVSICSDDNSIIAALEAKGFKVTECADMKGATVLITEDGDQSIDEAASLNIPLAIVHTGKSFKQIKLEGLKTKAEQQKQPVEAAKNVQNQNKEEKKMDNNNNNEKKVEKKIQIYTGFFSGTRGYDPNMLVSIANKVPQDSKVHAICKALVPDWTTIVGPYKAGKIDAKEYTRLYEAQLEKLDVKTFAEAFDHKILVCYEGLGKFCHRHIVASWFKKHGYACEEVTPAYKYDQPDDKPAPEATKKVVSQAAPATKTAATNPKQTVSTPKTGKVSPAKKLAALQSQRKALAERLAKLDQEIEQVKKEAEVEAKVAALEAECAKKLEEIKAAYAAKIAELKGAIEPEKKAEPEQPKAEEKKVVKTETPKTEANKTVEPKQPKTETKAEQPANAGKVVGNADLGNGKKAEIIQTQASAAEAPAPSDTDVPPVDNDDAEAPVGDDGLPTPEEVEAMQQEMLNQMLGM